MKKSSLAAICALLMCVLFAVPAGAAEVQGAQGLVISETLSIRAEANASSDAIAEAKNGETLTILSENNNWYRVRFDDNTTNAHGEGYVLKRFMVPSPEYATAIGQTYVYAMPAESAKMVGEVDAGTQLAVIGEWGDFWAVNLRTASGFVRKGDVDYSGVITSTPRPQPTATPENPVARGSYIVIRDTGLYAQPTTAAPMTGEIVNGSLVVISHIRNGFGQIVESGLWVSMNDIQRYTPGTTLPPLETSQPEAFRYLVIRDGASVYTEPNTTSAVTDTLNNGDIVIVHGTSGDMAMVSYGRQRGWMLQSDLLSLHR